MYPAVRKGNLDAIGQVRLQLFPVDTRSEICGAASRCDLDLPLGCV